MKLPGELGHLTYCLNAHPAESWEECRAALAGPVAAVRDRVCPNEIFDVGLRFSNEALAALDAPHARAELVSLLAEQGFRALTVNGFPYGPFHGARVKENVYQPDWTRPERLAYTTGLIQLMAEIGPEDMPISLSTVPGAYKPLAEGREAAMAEAMLRAAAFAVQSFEDTGRTVALAIEPEPFCFLETIAETVAFFERHLFCDEAVAGLARRTGLPTAAAAAALPRHLGLCYDVCHAAVEFEDPAGSVAALKAAGIPIHKLQLSAALRVPSVDAEARAALAAFDEPTYLHQVVSRRGVEPMRREHDLAPALARDDSDGEEWRVHFHVPIFVDEIPPFRSTQGFLAEMLALHRRTPLARHLEVETYTWGVLPENLRSARIEDDIARELTWVRERLA